MRARAGSGVRAFGKRSGGVSRIDEGSGGDAGGWLVLFAHAEQRGDERERLLDHGTVLRRAGEYRVDNEAYAIRSGGGDVSCAGVCGSGAAFFGAGGEGREGASRRGCSSCDAGAS